MMLLLFRLAAALIPKIPARLVYRLADWIADLLWLGARRLRATIEANQRRAIGPGATPLQLARNSRQVLRTLLRVYVDEFRMPHLSNQALNELATIHNLEPLEAALAQGRGVIMVSAHVGAPHIVGQLFTVLGYPTTVVVEHTQPEELFQFICEMRSRRGVRLLPADEPLLPLLRTLRKENGIVGLVVDRNVNRSGFCLPFLGEPTLVPDGAVRLALRARVPLLIGICRRRPDHRYEAIVETFEFSPSASEDAEAHIRAETARLMGRLEYHIRREPAQWLMTVPLGDEGCP